MLLPDYFEFYCPVKTVAGNNALNNIGRLLKELQASRPLIITDKGVTGAGLINIVKEAIKDEINIGATFDNVPADSDVKIVNDIAKIYRENNCDSIIAVGGGSVLDTAKGVNIVVSENSDDLMHFTGAGVLNHPLNPLIAVPTTAGTGSEMTLVAVIADHEKQQKLPFTSYFLLPNVAVIDPRMTLTLPSFITSPTAMDALTHAVEAYTCLAKNPLSDVSALNAIALISQNLLNVIKHPKDSKGRLALANASTIAGIAFSNSMVGMVHTLGHSVGALTRIPHGVCMAILLPYGLEYNQHKNGHLTAELLLPLAGPEVYANTPKDDRTKKTIEYIRKLNQDLHDATHGFHYTCFKEVVNMKNKNQVFPKERIPEIAKLAQGDGSKFYNPEAIDYEDCVRVLEAAWEGTPL